jgi:MinD-like ATPase involved in chromosome partitioning or flagellar assembly
VNRLRVITIAGDADLETRLAWSLSERRDIEVVLRCVDRVEVLAASEGGSLDAALVLGVPRWLDRDLVEGVVSRSIRVVGIPAGIDDLGPLEDLGCEVLPAGVSDESVVERLREVPMVLPQASPTSPSGRSVVVWGPKGAPGRTRIAIELAYMAGSSGTSTALVDADPHGGDVAQLLDVSSDAPGLAYLSRHVEDLASLEGNLGWATVVPGIVDPSRWCDVTIDGWSRLTSALRSAHSLTLHDVGFGLDAPSDDGRAPAQQRHEVARSAIADASHVLAVFRGDPVGVKHLLWGIDQLRHITEMDRVILVANQVASGDERPLRDALQRHLGRTPDAIVPLRPERFAEALRKGRPVSASRGTSDVTRGLDHIARRMGATTAARGILTRLGGRG